MNYFFLIQNYIIMFLIYDEEIKSAFFKNFSDY